MDQYPSIHPFGSSSVNPTNPPPEKRESILSLFVQMLHNRHCFSFEYLKREMGRGRRTTPVAISPVCMCMGATAIDPLLSTVKQKKSNTTPIDWKVSIDSLFLWILSNTFFDLDLHHSSSSSSSKWWWWLACAQWPEIFGWWEVRYTAFVCVSVAPQKIKRWIMIDWITSPLNPFWWWWKWGSEPFDSLTRTCVCDNWNSIFTFTLAPHKNEIDPPNHPPLIVSRFSLSVCL